MSCRSCESQKGETAGRAEDSWFTVAQKGVRIQQIIKNPKTFGIGDFLNKIGILMIKLLKISIFCQF